MPFTQRAGLTLKAIDTRQCNILQYITRLAPRHIPHTCAKLHLSTILAEIALAKRARQHFLDQMGFPQQLLLYEACQGS